MKLTVYGIPAPQGSKRHVGNGRMIESSKKVKPWREAVKAAAQSRIAAICAPSLFAPMDGPLKMEVVFTLPAPKRLSKKLASHPTTTPDLSKLIRSTEDALTDAGLWADDSRVIAVLAAKTYPSHIIGSHVDALPVPGAVIIVTPAFGP